MNEIQILNDYIIDMFANNDLVNTISIVPTFNIDLNKENIYPLVNIDLIDSDIQADVIVASFEITAVQQRDVKKKVLNSKLLEDSNYLDNMNETHFVVSKFINQLQKQNNEFNIEISNISNIRFLKMWGLNGLDGCQFTIDLSIPILGSSC